MYEKSKFSPAVLYNFIQKIDDISERCYEK